MCWVLVVFYHRAGLLSAPSGEAISGTSEALGQTMVPKENVVSPEPLTKAGAGEMVPLAAGGGSMSLNKGAAGRGQQLHSMR